MLNISSSGSLSNSLSISQKWLPRFAHNFKNISQNACVAGKMSKRSIANQTSSARPADQRFAQAEMSKAFNGETKTQVPWKQALAID